MVENVQLCPFSAKDVRFLQKALIRKTNGCIIILNQWYIIFCNLGRGSIDEIINGNDIDGFDF